MAGMNSRLCQNCGSTYQVAKNVQQWTCPQCNAINGNAIGAAERILGTEGADRRGLPVGKQWQLAWDRMRGRTPLYGYDRQVVVVVCPQCQTRQQVATSVQFITCVSCSITVQIQG